MGETRSIVRATREVTVIIHGEEYDALLIPRKEFVEVDFTKFPEDDPLHREINSQKLAKIQLNIGSDLTDISSEHDTYQLTEAGARRLLESL